MVLHSSVMSTIYSQCRFIYTKYVLLLYSLYASCIRAVIAGHLLEHFPSCNIWMLDESGNIIAYEHSCSFLTYSYVV